MITAGQIIERLKLQPHPEGGFFKESYRSKESISASELSEHFKGSRNHSTAIYYLLESGDFSAFHKINQDEIWHFYLGSPIELYIMPKEDSIISYIIGNNIENGEVLQCVVPKNHWFAAKPLAENSFSLLGCTVSPGFDFRDFTIGVRSELLREFPDHEELITMFTRP